MKLKSKGCESSCETEKQIKNKKKKGKERESKGKGNQIKSKQCTASQKSTNPVKTGETTCVEKPER